MFPLLFAAALAFTPQDARLAYETADTLVRTCTPRDAGTEDGRRAARFLFEAVQAVGAHARLDCFRAAMPQGERTLVNLTAEFPSGVTNAPWVILVSHYDTKTGTRCPGANDGAATSGLLVSLAGVLSRARTLRNNVLLLWTDGEECVVAYGETDGLWGSKRAAAEVVRRGLKVKAVVCLDMLGDADLDISVPANGSSDLIRAVGEAARQASFPDLVRTIPCHVKDDHEAFLARGIPAVDLIDFNYGPENAHWHTAQDTMDRVSERSLLKAGKVVVELLNILPSRSVSP